MGARAQVKIEDTGVFLYTHWGSGEIEDTVRKALQRRQRWNDDEYLTRIVFSQMTRGREDEEFGFGIGTSKHGDIDTLITLNVKAQTVTVTDIWGETEETFTFTEFIGGVS